VLALMIAALVAAQAAVAPMRTIDHGTQSGIDEARNVTARSADEWVKIWRAHAGEKPLPPVDFSREMVVGVFLGSRPTAGYGVEIVGTRDEPMDTLVVQYRIMSPARDAMTAQIITTPYHLVAVSERLPSVRFEKVP
jgi:hypothetical protein